MRPNGGRDLRPGAQDRAAAFRLDNISLEIGGRPILKQVTLDFATAGVTGLIGHNGSGKSSLLKLMARQTIADKGEVIFDGIPVGDYPARGFARRVAYLPQDIGAGADMSVRELVASGRYPWHGALGRFTDDDRQKVDAALSATHLSALEDRAVGTLSGGERQRAWIAMLVAQDSGFLLLDEPTAALDIAHQIEVLTLIRTLSREQGLGVAVVLHDVNLAARFCDHIHALREGEVVASGTPGELIRPQMLKTIYGLDMDIIAHPVSGLPLAYVR